MQLDQIKLNREELDMAQPKKRTKRVIKRSKGIGRKSIFSCQEHKHAIIGISAIQNAYKDKRRITLC